MTLRGTRPADHAGSWYTASPTTLSRELDDWLAEVPAVIDGSGLPVPGARAIIAPHAGYRYSGPCAAWAYKALDLSKAKRVFVLGPSHTFYLRGCALTTFAKYATPFGDFDVDGDTVAALRATRQFKDIPRPNDIREHSLEMHLPYLWKSLERERASGSGSASATPATAWPPIVPIMVGDGDGAAEREYGRLLLPYLRDPQNAFIISSDFCHWGRNFEFWPYCPGPELQDIRSLVPGSRSSGSRPAAGQRPVHEFIRVLDEAAFDAIETGSQAAFVDYLHETENTVCGRHPISVMMAALEGLVAEAGPEAAAAARSGKEQGTQRAHNKFAFVRYDRSELAETSSDSSVSYAAAYAVF